MNENVSMVLTLLTGVALFLFGMSAMSDGLKKVAGNKMELILYKLTNSPLKGFLLGTAVTCVIQSSSAATVMVVGFVNSGMMKVTQAIGVILGANIGTSITGWIVSMSYIDGAGWASYFSSTTITAVVALIGVGLKLFAKKEVLKNTGNIFLGFAVLMSGMSMMSGAVSPLRSNPVFLDMMSTLTNPFISGAFGILFAGILQSSSAAVGVVQALSTTGAITFNGAFPLIMGIGVGASFPVLLAAVGSSKNGKRTAFMYLLVSVIAMILGALVYYPLAMAGIVNVGSDVMNPFSLALMNSGFRIITMTLMLPFVKVLKKLIYMLIPSDPAETEDLPEFEKLDDRLLTNPNLAFQRAMEVMDGMAHQALKNVKRSTKLLDSYSKDGYRRVAELEQSLNKYEDKLGKYLVKLTAAGVNADQGAAISKSLQAIADFEAIGDYALQIADVAKEMHEKKTSFTMAAMDELMMTAAAMEEAMEITVDCYIKNDPKECKRVFPLRELVSVATNAIKKKHIARLKKGECSMENGFYQSDLLTSMQRVVDHCANICLDLVKAGEQDFNVHRFLRKYQEEQKSEYADLLSQYEVKYSI